MNDSSTETEEELKLSDYILAGIKETRKLRDDYIQPGKRGGPVRACAVGAACYVKDHARAVELGNAYGMVEAYEAFPELHDEVELSDRRQAKLGLKSQRIEDLGDLVMALNDNALWPRDRIARYIRKLGY
jgi:hypothetical protein